MTDYALETDGLGRRYRRGWALRECSFRLPAGRLCALVGPNGAGKTTLLSLAADLLTPSTGVISLFGDAPASPAARRRTAFLGQDKALYKRFRVEEILRMGRELNPSWDQARAEQIIAEGDVPLSAKVGTLSGGQRTRVAFALALGKRPELVLLDEPMADLDPLVRRQMTDMLVRDASQNGTTVVMSSHMVAELEGVCDYLVLINKGTVRLAGEIDTISEAHLLVTAPDAGPGRQAELAGHEIVESRTADGRFGALVRPDGPLPRDWQTTRPSLEDLLLAHLRTTGAPALITASAQVGGTAARDAEVSA
ncbi:ABC transporter ATP-binding protein [Streptomyces sp. PsTaAH-124]|uniref:ABC transporter ATP-binding protein n=1 Tax=Streptomyces sp. PsTaAH-124 TaxID=1157638 RepID=UPI000363BFAE|nr:ABC transporter ATP-binding protein [Streptomyces sp. PsTaAH-124]